jgi:hypothetical protein
MVEILKRDRMAMRRRSNEVCSWKEEKEEHERQMEGENANYVALTPEVNTNNGNNNPAISVSERIVSKENGLIASNCLDSNSNNNNINSGGTISSKGGCK